VFASHIHNIHQDSSDIFYLTDEGFSVITVKPSPITFLITVISDGSILVSSLIQSVLGFVVVLYKFKSEILYIFLI